eukprot:TRINITY_DN11326_c0_g1_i2.p1 TRINITY_DN11326_c0_g1~~TRINITY_DN11326_c0_g1_i2.p1  ORF type:complete len:394 (-),score=41.39 TRINITY_DN11326_c0_g1_i2:356-1423(-)
MGSPVIGCRRYLFSGISGNQQVSRQISYPRKHKFCLKNVISQSQNQQLKVQTICQQHNVKSDVKQYVVKSSKTLQFVKTMSVTIAGVCMWNLLSGFIFTNAAFASTVASNPGAQAMTRCAGSGLMAGMLHTLCGPDHLAALTPLTMGRGKFVAGLLGALWGFGHGTGQLCLGLAFTFLKERYKQVGPLLEKWSGVVVALTLIAIGLVGLIEILQGEDELELQTLPTAQLAYAGADGGGNQNEGGLAGGRAWTTYATGVVYGLQPDALYVVVPALALSIKLATAYCFMFVIGTVASMVGFSVLVGSASEQLKERHPHILRNFSIAACMVAMGAGAGLLVLGDGFSIKSIIIGAIGT